MIDFAHLRHCHAKLLLLLLDLFRLAPSLLNLDDIGVSTSRGQDRSRSVVRVVGGSSNVAAGPVGVDVGLLKASLSLSSMFAVAEIL